MTLLSSPAALLGRQGDRQGVSSSGLLLRGIAPVPRVLCAPTGETHWLHIKTHQAPAPLHLLATPQGPATPAPARTPPQPQSSTLTQRPDVVLMNPLDDSPRQLRAPSRKTSRPHALACKPLWSALPAAPASRGPWGVLTSSSRRRSLPCPCAVLALDPWLTLGSPAQAPSPLAPASEQLQVRAGTR